MPRTIELDQALLVLIAKLEGRGFRRIREYDLHSLVCSLAPRWWPWLRFITKPTIYSTALHKTLHDLERRGSINELILVHDAWAPRHEYDLTRMGRIRAMDAIDRLESLAEGVSEDLDASLGRWASGPPEKHGEEYRSYPSNYG